VGLLSTAKKVSHIGIDLLPDGVAVAQLQTGNNHLGSSSDEHPKVSAKVAMSTLSTGKEWVGI
jgi:hypothetical protein